MRGYHAAVRSWADHLAAGGRDTWRQHRAQLHDLPSPSQLSTQPRSELVPTATQLALLSRLAGQAEHLAGLARVVLSTPPSGRGHVEIPLPWPVEHRFGSPACEPEELPTPEILRQATATLCVLLGQPPSSAPEVTESNRLTPPWRKRFRLHGPPGWAGAVRNSLRARGMVESNRKPHHLVCVAPIDQMVFDEWATGVTTDALAPYHHRWRLIQRRSGLPKYARPGDHLSTLPDERTTLVAGATLTEAARHAVAAMGVADEPSVAVGDAPSLEVRRRINTQLRIMHGASSVLAFAPLLDRVLPQPVPRPLTIPRSQRDWAQQQSQAQQAQLRRQLGERRIRVLGDVDSLNPSDSADTAINLDSACDVAVAAIINQWREHPWRGE